MCGLLGFVSAGGDAGRHEEIISAALEGLHHRGPDETGVETIAGDVVFGFKRLSIIDVALSHQPLHYADGRYVIVFNGEIYNYVELREELVRDCGAQFATTGDTEVIVAAYHHWGPDALRRLRGMFSFVIWDRVDRRAFGARDPFGIKPLYYLESPAGLAFASEKKALLAWAQVVGASIGDVDEVALAHYLTLQYVPEPASLHTGIRRLECGEAFTYAPGGTLDRTRYYRPVFRPAATDRPEYLYERIRDTLRESVRLHMRADVPVGAFLSSGIDSTAVVALAREVNPSILTFTVGFDVPGYSEIEVARESARWLGVATLPTMIGPNDMMEALPRIVWHLDDPVADPALVPLYFVARKASEHVKVVVSGEGADEFFGGYGIYREPLSLRHLTRLPSPLKRGLRALSRIIPEGVKGKSFLERGTTPIEERYFGNARIFSEAEKSSLMRRYDPAVQYTDVTAPVYEACRNLDDITRMQYVDLFTWLRGDILVKADRMSMAHSLEVRVPFLDTGVFDIAATIPPELKVTPRGGIRKFALRRALAGVVPPHIVNRPKLGFPTPTRVWLKEAMYEWALDILSTSGAGHLIDLDYTRRLLDAHRRGAADHSRKIWTVLVFCVWHAIFVEGSLDPRPQRAVSALAPKPAEAVRL